MTTTSVKNNAFFAHFLAHARSERILVAAQRTWIVLVPQQASLAGFAIDSTAFLNAHIIFPFPLQPFLIDSKAEFNSQSASYTHTAGVDDCNVETEVTITGDLLFSEHGVSFSVFCIDAPLIATEKQPISKSLSHQKVPETHQSILSLARLFGTVRNIKTGSTILDEINEEVDSFNENVLEMENLDVVQSAMRIIQRMDRKLLESICNDSDVDESLLYQLAESYVMESTYEFTYFVISKSLRDKDTAMSANIASIDTLDLIQLGVSSKFGESLMHAVQVFKQLPTVRTPFEKIKCLMESIRMLSSKTKRHSFNANGKESLSNSTEILLSSDVLIPLMVIIVVRSDIQNLPSLLYYMQNFSFEHDVVGGENGYALATLEAVITYIESSANSLAETCSKNVALWKAISEDDVKSVTTFFDETTQDGEESIVYIRNSDGDSLLHLACRCRSLKVIEYLISKKFSPNIQNYSLETPFLIACEMSDPHCIQLLATPSSNSASNKLGMNPFHLCRDANIISTTLVPLLGISAIKNRNIRGHTPLLHHCHQGATAATIAILEASDYDITLTDNAHRNVLHIAAFNGSLEIIEYVLEHVLLGRMTNKQKDKILNTASVRGNTCLHAAASSSVVPANLAIVKALVAADASISVKNGEGKIPVDVTARGTSGAEIREFLDSSMVLDVAKREVGDEGGGGNGYGDGRIVFSAVGRVLQESGGGTRAFFL
ncbi:hypothetical protein HK100_005725, partial [Physocladia obscura]